MISLIVNGESRRTTAKTVSELVRELSLDPSKVAVEHNGTIAPRSGLATHTISDGDTLEIVHFVGGGQEPRSEDSWCVAGRTLDLAVRGSVLACEKFPTRMDGASPEGQLF